MINGFFAWNILSSPQTFNIFHLPRSNDSHYIENTLVLLYIVPFKTRNLFIEKEADCVLERVIAISACGEDADN